MQKRVYESELRELLMDCFVEAFSDKDWFNKDMLSITINSIYAKISYAFPTQYYLKNKGMETFNNLLSEYCGNNLKSIEKNDGIIIQINYEVIPSGD